VDESDEPAADPTICDICGAVIGDAELHTRWHADLPTPDGWPKPRSTRPGV
jgi:hypothetical protein